ASSHDRCIWGGTLMSTVIYYECRDPHHLAAPSRYGIGGIVFRHGTAAYCDAVGADAQHHWVPTGGVPIETLVRGATASFAAPQTRREDPDDAARTRAGYVSNDSGIAGALPAHP
ncbi:MAG TPA: hypothetical protein VM052_03090, partial [Candidatus Limnocylindrales bacterium]|nr:hypothetical protein [Candidatus Limnocylindrales bacterium]